MQQELASRQTLCLLRSRQKASVVGLGTLQRKSDALKLELALLERELCQANASLEEAYSEASLQLNLGLFRLGGKVAA